MNQSARESSPQRVGDLIAARAAGAEVVCQTSFEILPVDFQHRDHPFQAHIFLCKYSGTINQESFTFRKCYARGCPNNLCPHVSQAVMIANRHLQRDYDRLEKAGIEMAQELFELPDMMVRFEESKRDFESLLSLDELIELVKKGGPITVVPSLELVPAVEHFANQKEPMIFLMAQFQVQGLEKPYRYERCLACYPVKDQDQERPAKVEVANQRLKLIYQQLAETAFETTQILFS